MEDEADEEDVEVEANGSWPEPLVRRDPQ